MDTIIVNWEGPFNPREVMASKTDHVEDWGGRGRARNGYSTLCDFLGLTKDQSG